MSVRQSRLCHGQDEMDPRGKALVGQVEVQRGRVGLDERRVDEAEADSLSRQILNRRQLFVKRFPPEINEKEFKQLGKAVC